MKRRDMLKGLGIGVAAVPAAAATAAASTLPAVVQPGLTQLPWQLPRPQLIPGLVKAEALAFGPSKDNRFEESAQLRWHPVIPGSVTVRITVGTEMFEGEEGYRVETLVDAGIVDQTVLEARAEMRANGISEQDTYDVTNSSSGVLVGQGQYAGRVDYDTGRVYVLHGMGHEAMVKASVVSYRFKVDGGAIDPRDPAYAATAIASGQDRWERKGTTLLHEKQAREQAVAFRDGLDREREARKEGTSKRPDESIVEVVLEEDMPKDFALKFEREKV